MKIIFFLIFFFTSCVFSQEKENFEEPLYWDIYREKKIVEEPKLDYDDIEISHPGYTFPEINKHNVLYNIIFSTPSIEKQLTVLLGDKSFLSKVRISNFLHRTSLDLSLLTERKKVENTSPITVSHLDFQYNKIFPSTIFHFDTDIYSHIFTTLPHQYKFNFSLTQLLLPKLSLVFSPRLFYFKETKTLSEFLFLSNYAGLNFSPYYKFSTSLGFFSLTFDKIGNTFPNLRLVFKDIIFYQNKAEIEFYVRDKIENLYYKLNLEQKVRNLFLSVMYSKKYDYEYIYTYFVKYPNFQLSEQISIPDTNDTRVKIKYDIKELKMSTEFIYQDYTFFPSYKLISNNILTSEHIGDVQLYSFSYEISKMLIPGIDLYFKIKSTNFSKDILFYPKFEFTSGIGSQIKLSKRLRSDIKFSFTGKDKILTDFHSGKEKEYISGLIDLDFWLKDEISINFLYNYPILNKSYLQPGLYLEPNFLFGGRIKF